MKRYILYSVAGLFGGVLIGFPDLAHALQQDSGVADLDVNSFNASVRHLKEYTFPLWERRAMYLGGALFSSLATLQVVLFGYRYMVHDELPSRKTVKREGLILLFYGLLLFAASELKIIVNGLMQMAGWISGVPQNISSMGMVSKGIEAIMSFKGQEGLELTVWDVILGPIDIFGDAILYAFGTLFFLGGFIIIALQYAFITVEVLIMTAIAPIPIAFGALDQTRDIADSYIQQLFHLGFKLFFFIIIFSVSFDLVMSWGENLATTHYADGNTWPLGDLIEGTLILFLLVTLLAKLPAKFASAITNQMDISIEDMF